MKKFLLSLATLGLLAVPAQAHHVDTHAHDVTIKVSGLVCDFCARTVEKVFAKKDEVSAVAVDLDTHEINIDFKAGAVMENEAIYALIVDSGYTVTEIIR